MSTPLIRNVYVILDPNFGGQLLTLPASEPVWIISSEVNTPVIKELWQAATKNGRNITSFQGTPEQELMSLLITVHEHHGPSSQLPEYTQLTILGLSHEQLDADELADLGLIIMQSLPHGVIVSLLL